MRDSGRGSFANLSDRDLWVLRDAEQQGLHLSQEEIDVIAPVVRRLPQYLGQDEEEYELTIIDELRMALPPGLVPHESAVRLFIASVRADHL
jgi:hypothetical protein